MRKLTSNLIGIDQGKVDLFSDFESGGPMWTGSGDRERRRKIAFAERFVTPPAVHVSLALWDIDSNSNVRCDVQAENIGEQTFDIVFRTWDNTRVARVHISWMAIGALPNEDDWDID